MDGPYPVPRGVAVGDCPRRAPRFGLPATRSHQPPPASIREPGRLLVAGGLTFRGNRFCIPGMTRQSRSTRRCRSWSSRSVTVSARDSGPACVGKPGAAVGCQANDLGRPRSCASPSGLRKPGCCVAPAGARGRPPRYVLGVGKRWSSSRRSNLPLNPRPRRLAIRRMRTLPGGLTMKWRATHGRNTASRSNGPASRGASMGSASAKEET